MFTLVAIAVPVGWSGDRSEVLGLVALTAIFATAIVAPTATRRLDTVVLEALAVGAVAGATLHGETSAILAALVIPPFVAGLRQETFGVLVVVSAELVTLLATTLLFRHAFTESVSLDVFTWAVTSLGVGLVVAYATSLPHRAPDPLAPYRHARGLLAELLHLSGGLSSGLDPDLLATDLVRRVRDTIPSRDVVVLVPRGDDLTPLRTEDGLAPGHVEEVAALGCHASSAGVPVVEHGLFVIPVLSEGRLLALVGGTLANPEGTTAEKLLLRPAGVRLTAQLEATAVRLDTALLFAAFRDNATADERRRLAREMHDGVAQDIASMGYLVDALAAGAASEEQREQLRALRGRITSVVKEVRRSVLTLRSEVGESESLGAAIGALARHLSDSSEIPITVTVDERTTRLRPAVEAELLRIAQEAMTNAVRHAGADRIDVTCRVDPPFAEIVVADDGSGLGSGRSDSFGLTIMRERATLIGADLAVDSDSGGTQVSVRVSPAGPARPPEPAPGPARESARRSGATR